MTQQHPVPPPELLEQWENDWLDERETVDALLLQAFQAGADQELDACYALVDAWGLDGEDLMECRRPKPPSLKEQALAALNEIEDRYAGPSTQEILIRRALEQLDD